MIRKSYSFFILIVLFVLAIAFTLPPKRKIIWPEKVYNEKNNPPSTEKKELGRLLFYDPILSSDNTISCSSCHLSYTAFTHTDHAVSHGVFDRVGKRNAPALFNLAWKKNFMWDGAVHNLDAQAMAPIENVLEMNETLANVVKKLNERKFYREYFFQAWGDSLVTGERVLKSISQFMLSFVSNQSKYDEVLAEKKTFTEQEQKGYVLFQKNCNACHTEPLFTNDEFKSNGLPFNDTLNDFGRSAVTTFRQDRLTFKVPSLRNVEMSFPYMHDGRFKTLQQVLNHYTSLTGDEENISPPLNHSVNLSSNEKQDLIAFLLTLTDHEFLTRKDYQFPQTLQHEIIQRSNR
jgi:cytochrome c peroxidase